MPEATDDLLVDLEALIEQIPAAQQRARFGDELERVGNWYQQKADTLASFSTMVGACEHLHSHASDGDRNAIRDGLKEMGDFGRDTARVVDAAGLASVREMAGDAHKAMIQCQAALRRAVQALVASEFLPLRATGELVGDLDPSSTLGQRLVDFALRASSLHNAAPTDFPGAVRSACAEAAGYRAEIDAIAHLPERKVFLNALVAGNATLADVTPTIIEWLSAKGGLQRFAVRPQSQTR